MGQKVTSIVKALIIAGAILILGKCADNITSRIWPSELPKNTTDTVRVVLHTRDTVLIEKPKVIVNRDTIWVERIDSSGVYKFQDYYKSGDLDLRLKLMASCVDNIPSIFNLSYEYGINQMVIYDTTVVSNTVTNTEYVRLSNNHLSIGLGAMIPGPYYKLDINHHKGWYYYGGSVGYFNGSPVIGVNLGININLK